MQPNQNRARKSMDIIRKPVRSRPRVQNVPQPPAAFTRKTFKPPVGSKTFRARLYSSSILFYFVVSVTVFVVAVRLSTDPFLGEIVIGVIGLLVLIFKLKSKYIFLAASIVFLSILVDIFILRSTMRAQNTALFAFLLLVVGFISLVLETHRLAKLKKY